MVELACLWVGASHRGGEGGAWEGGEALGESAGEGELKAREGEQQEWKESHASVFLSGVYPNSVFDLTGDQQRRGPLLVILFLRLDASLKMSWTDPMANIHLDHFIFVVSCLCFRPLQFSENLSCWDSKGWRQR